MSYRQNVLRSDVSDVVQTSSRRGPDVKVYQIPYFVRRVRRDKTSSDTRQTWSDKFQTRSDKFQTRSDKFQTRSDVSDTRLHHVCKFYVRQNSDVSDVCQTWLLQTCLTSVIQTFVSDVMSVTSDSRLTRLTN